MWVKRTILKMYANLINLDPAAGMDQIEIGHAGPRGKCTHRCDIHEVECCDDSPENTENTDVYDLAGTGPESILSLRNLVDPGVSKTYMGTN